MRGVALYVGINEMKIGLLTDLAAMTERQLMARLRRQFASSIGIALILFVLAWGATIIPDAKHNGPVIQSIAMFGVFELWTWGAFVRAWRELKGRIDKNS